MSYRIYMSDSVWLQANGKAHSVRWFDAVEKATATDRSNKQQDADTDGILRSVVENGGLEVVIA